MLLVIIALFMLSGCESLGDVIREKKYNVKLHEAKTKKSTSTHKLGYNDDYDYVGYMVEGNFQ